jgi:hypothetical protein
MHAHKHTSSLLLIDAEDRIVADVLCIRCACNLRNLKIAERCPNCNHPVSDSVHGDYLIHADKPLVRGLAESAQVIEYGMLILESLMGLALLAALISDRSVAALVEHTFRIVYAGAMISPVIATIGLVLLTTRHTAAYYWVRYGNKRTLLRGGLVFALILAVAVTCTLFFGIIALEIGTVFWFAIPLAAFLRGLERLMSRVPNKQLAAFSRGMFVGLIAFGLFAILIFVVEKLAADDPSWSESLAAFRGLAGVGGILLGVMAHQLLLRVRRTLLSIAR